MSSAEAQLSMGRRELTWSDANEEWWTTVGDRGRYVDDSEAKLVIKC